MKTRVTELLGIEKPIIQGGMAWVAESHLAAAVSNAGGFGLIHAEDTPHHSDNPFEAKLYSPANFF